MSSTNYTRWWRDGSIAATKNSNEVVGTSTYWATTNINPGDIMKINGVDYEVQKVTDDTHITLATPYTGETGSGLEYAIVRNFTSTTNAKVAAQTSELMYDFAHFIDKEHATITGKSAYEIAKDNGYVGTEAQWLESLSAYGQAKKNGYTGTMAEWLESLKADGEWSNADSRLAALESRYAHIPQIQNMPADYKHNMFPRFKNLGTSITAAQYTAIANTSFDDIYVGDYWELPINLMDNGGTMRAFVVEVGNENLYNADHARVNNGIYQTTQLHIMLYTGIKHSYEGTNYKDSVLRTEVLPEILAAVESYIGADHILKYRMYVDDGTEPDALGQEHEVAARSKMELFHVKEVAYYHGAVMSGRIAPFALFRNMYKTMSSNTLMSSTPFLPATFWLQERASSEMAYSYSIWAQEINANLATYGWINVVPHFVLIY